MIRTLRTRLVAAAMLSLLVVLTVILGVILLGSYRGIVSDADRILDLLAEGEGTFPTLPADFNWEEEGPRRRSPELGYEIRYFSVLLDESGNVATTDLGQIAAVDQETAEAYAQQVRAQGHTRGFLQDYRYLTAKEGDQTRIIFLDYSGYLFTFRSTLFTGLWVSAVGLLAVFLLLLLLSRRIIRPILESYEKQKRFITDAGCPPSPTTSSTSPGWRSPSGRPPSSPCPSRTWWRRPPSPSRPWPRARGKPFLCASSPPSPWWGRRRAWGSWCPSCWTMP